MFENLIEKKTFQLINGSDKYQGLWTRTIENQKSVISLLKAELWLITKQ